MTDVSREVSSFIEKMGIDRSLQRQLSGSHNIAGSWVTSEVQGLAELERNLNELPEKIARGVLRKAVTDASELFRARAAGGAPYDPRPRSGKGRAWKTMHLRDAILKQITTRFQGVKGATIRGKVGLDKKHAFYGRFIEFGWTHVGGKQIPARPFMRTAWEAMKGVALALFETRLRTGIEAAARELHRQ